MKKLQILCLNVLHVEKKLSFVSIISSWVIINALSLSHIMLWLNNPDLIGFLFLKLNSRSLSIRVYFLSKLLFILCVYIEILGDVSVDLADSV